jgi:PRTRC genetic system protein A
MAMHIREAILAESLPLPPMAPDLAYQYVVAGNGLFIRAEDSRMEALVPVALTFVHGLEIVEPYARLKLPRVAAGFLAAVLESARRHLPNEAMYQFIYAPTRGAVSPWKCCMPEAQASAGAIHYDGDPEAVVDLHSHGLAAAFFSDTDDGDEQGLRFYVVVGEVNRSIVDLEGKPPQIAARVGVYGHRWNVPVETIFDGPGPFVQVDPEVEMVLAEVDDEATL